MSLFVAAVAALLALVTWTLHRRLAVAPHFSYAAQRVAAVVLALGSVAVLVGFAMQGGVIDPRQARWAAWLGMTWVAMMWYLLLGVMVVGVVCLVVRIAGRGELRRQILRFGSPLVVVTAVAVTGYGLVEAGTPHTTTVTLTNDQLPEAFDGLRIALVTDLHVGPVRDAGFTRRVVEQVNAERPDLVVLGGDLADGKVAQVGAALEPLADLEARYGVVAVTGNHEYISGEPDAWLALWERLGIQVLRNSNLELQQDGATIRVAGLEDPAGAGVGQAPDAARALSGIDRRGFTVLVAHQPKMAELVQARDVDLQLSGHTHGGQLWPFHYLVRLQQPVLDGLSPIGDVPVLTSRGAGAWGPPVRVLAEPEVPVITLRRP